MARIAEEVGLSPRTVWLALRGKGGILVHTRRRVVDKARELGYVTRLTPRVTIARPATTTKEGKEGTAANEIVGGSRSGQCSYRLLCRS